MNIVAFKDKIHPEDEWFNQELKGRYAYLIQMKYVVTLDLDRADYIRYEQDSTALTGSDRTWRDLDALKEYVDEARTRMANDISSFLRENKYVTDEDITLDELKVFRSWLASSLLEFDIHEDGTPAHNLFNDLFTRTLQYYAHGRYDETVRILSEITPVLPSITTPDITDCGCAGHIQMTSLNLVGCDALEIYRNHLHAQMEEHFREIEFWRQFPAIFLIEFKEYIDNILRLNLPLQAATSNINYQDCACLPDTAQQANQEILRRLSRTLQYMADGEVDGHRNFMADALRDWSSKLYEVMYWA